MHGSARPPQGAVRGGRIGRGTGWSARGGRASAVSAGRACASGRGRCPPVPEDPAAAELERLRLEVLEGLESDGGSDDSNQGDVLVGGHIRLVPPPTPGLRLATASSSCGSSARLEVASPHALDAGASLNVAAVSGGSRDELLSFDGSFAGVADQSGGELTESAFLAAVALDGVDHVEDATQLVFRHRSVRSLTTASTVDFARLASLEILSLSHNALTDISPLSSLESLAEVNLNFNQIVDIRPLFDCDRLEKIFVSHNHVESIAGIDVGCPRLKELSLYSNRLTDGRGLSRTLASLPELRNLDIGENACCGGPSERYSLLQSLPRLEYLDSLKISATDGQCANNFFETQASGSDAVGVSDTGVDRVGVGSQLEVGTASQQDGSAVLNIRPGTAPPAVLNARVGLGGGGSGFARPPTLPAAALSSGKASTGAPVAHLPGQKLRAAGANRMDDVLTRSPSPDVAGLRRALPSFDATRIDVADPERTFHMLAAHAEASRTLLYMLQMERENLRFQVRLLQRDVRDAQPDSLQESVLRLQEENRNISVVESERDQLSARLKEAEDQLAALRAVESDSGGGVDLAASAKDCTPNEDEDVLASLRWEGKLLEKRLQKLTSYSGELQQDLARARLESSAGDTRGGRIPSSSGGGSSRECVPTVPPIEGVAAAARAMDEEDAGDDGAALDLDIARMLAANEAGLRQLRGAVRDTATALARRNQVDVAASQAEKDERSCDGVGATSVDVMTIGADGDVVKEWHDPR